MADILLFKITSNLSHIPEGYILSTKNDLRTTNPAITVLLSRYDWFNTTEPEKTYDYLSDINDEMVMKLYDVLDHTITLKRIRSL